MTLLEFPRKFRPAGAPLLIMADLQLEYASEGRAFSVPGLGPCLKNCGRLLQAARDVHLPIAHFRQLQTGSFFNEDSDYSHWIDGFQPRPSERVYERNMPSCYHNGIFADYLDTIEKPELFLAGLTSDRACLSTIIEAAHRRHSVYFIEDASASRPLEQWPAGVCHAFMRDLIAQYCPVITTIEAIDHIQHTDPRRWEAFGG
jgi:nicotinamidase-related amidase